MFSITEQLSAATKTQVEAQLKILNDIAATAFEGAQQVIALNISTTKASVEKSSAAARRLLEAKDPQEFFSLSAARTPNLEGALAYGRELFSIASKTQASLFQAAKDQLKEAKVAAKPLAVAAPVAARPVAAAKVVEVVAESDFPVEAPAASPKAAAKAEAKAKPATPAKPVAEAVGVAVPKPAASFPDPKAANGTVKQLDMLAPSAKAKK